MRKIVPAISAAGVLTLAASSVTAQMLYEPFDYGSASVGTNLSNTTGTPTFTGYNNPMTGLNWANVQTGVGTAPINEISIISGSLTPSTGLQAATGNQVESRPTTTAARVARIAIAPGAFTSGTVYYSMLFKITDMSSFNTGSVNGGFFAGFNDTVGTATTNVGTVGARLHVRVDASDSTKYNVGVKANTNTNQLGVTLAYDPTQFSSGPSGDTVFVVGSFTLGDPSTAGDDISRMWVNPNPTTFGAGTEPATSLIVGAGTDFQQSAGIASFILRQLVKGAPGTALTPDAVQMDEVRVDTSWAGVTMPKGNGWTGAGNWSNNGNWDTASAPNSAGAVAAFFGSGGSVTIDSAKTVGILNIKSTTSYNIGNSANTLTFDGNGGNAMINVYAVMDSTGGPPPADPVMASSHTISAPIQLNSQLVTNIANKQTLTMSGVVADGGQGIVKRGAGTLVLANVANTYSGVTSIENGAVDITADGSLGTAPGGPATNIVLARGRLRFDAAMTLNANRTIQINGPGSTANVGILDTNGFDVTVPGVINGVTTLSSAGLTKAGAGTLTLQANNTYNQSFIQGGAMAVSSDTNLGNAPAAPNQNITMSNGGTLKFLAAFAPNANRHINLLSTGGGIDTNGFDITLATNRIFGAGGFAKKGAGKLTLQGTQNDYQGTTTISGGTLEVGASVNFGNDGLTNHVSLNGGTLRTTGTITSVNRQLLMTSVGGTVDTNGFDVTFKGINGTGPLAKNGGGNLISGRIGTNGPVTGNLTINAGHLTVLKRATTGGNSTTYITGKLSVNPAAALDLNDNDLVVQYGTSPSSFSDVRDLVFAGYSGTPDPSKTGIISSTGQTAGNTILAMFDNALVGATDWPLGSGHTIDANSVVGKYTYFGDMDLSGDVTADDYGILDANLGTTPPPGVAWLSGDADLSGDVTPDDYGILDANIGSGVGSPLSPSGVSAVPEPATLGLLGLGAGLLLRRARRKA